MVDSSIREALNPPDFQSGVKSLDSHLKFTERNSGRLVATFLGSFYIK